MKRFLSIILITLITFFTIPFGKMTGFASEDTSFQVKDGKYEIQINLLHEDKDEKSSAAGFIKEKAELVGADGENQLTITIPNNEMASIQGFQIEGIEPVISEDDENQYFTYNLAKIKEMYNARTQYEVPASGLEHDVALRIQLVGLEDLPQVEEEKEDPSQDSGDENSENEGNDENGSVGDENQEDPIKDEEESSLDALEDGYYFLHVKYLHASEDKGSAMTRYLGDKVFLSVKKDRYELTVPVLNHETVTKLIVDGKDPVETKVDRANNLRYETFQLEDLSLELVAFTEYQTPFNGGIHYGKADFRIVIDETGISEANASDKPGANLEEEPTKEEPKNPEQGKGDKSEDKPSEKPNEKPNEKPSEKPSDKPAKDEQDFLKPDVVYTVQYDILHSDGKNPSVADQFFVKPGILLEKAGEKYLQVAVQNGEMIKGLRNEFGDAILVQKNDDGSIVYQFKVYNDLSDMILTMDIHVPGLYEETHDAILVIDPNSLEEVTESDVELIGSGDENNVNGPFVKDLVPEKPSLGDRPDSPETDGDNRKELDQEENRMENPQTGDSTSLILYSILLIGSSIPLVQRMRSRFL